MLTIVPAPFAFAEETQDQSDAVLMSAEEGVITGFLPLQQEEFYYEGKPAAEELTGNLPQHLLVYLDGATEPAAIPVQWEIAEDYEETDYYFYSATPVWPEEFTLAESIDPLIEVPWITLFRQTSEEEVSDGEDEIEIPVEEPDELLPVEAAEEAAGVPEMTEVPAQTEVTEETEATEETEVTEEPDVQEGDGMVSLSDLLSLCTEESYAVSSSQVKKIYNYLTKTMGLNMAAACGVMTNLYAESGMMSNNLENTYNSRFGLSDAEYTKRVNAGIKNNGKYKTGGGATRYFTKDYCGYGLCQWTSLGRRASLLKLAVKKNTSIADSSMQLEFLKSELSSSYQQVWGTLRGVPNNATGAYLAAAHFCVAFEVPANTNSTAASRARTALSTYWKTYSGKSGSTSSSHLGICGYSYPKSIKTGKGMTCSGHVISNYTIKSVTAKIVNSKGNTVYSSTRKPGSTVYSLYNFDNSMKFGKLSAGSYTYVITAKDSSGKKVTAKHGFNVASSASTEALRGCAASDVSTAAAAVSQAPVSTEQGASTLRGVSLSYPKKLKKGKGFTVKGKVKSNYPLKKVVIIVTTKKGTKKLKASKTLSGVKTYNVKGLDEKIKFGKLKKGTYYYIVKATDSQKTKRLLKKKFTVK